MSQSQSRRIGVVIVTYNSELDIETCVRSVPRLPELKVVVVDNSSSDDTVTVVEQLRNLGLVDELVRSPDNLGFAKAVNIGITKLPGYDILLFNPDARMDESCLEGMLKHANEDGKVGIISPVVYSKSSVRTMTAGKQPRLWPMFTHFTGLSGLFPRVRGLEGRQLFLHHHADRDRYVEWVAGCCMYIKHELIASVGVLSERWFMYGEDVQYCKRATDAGFTILLAHDARCFHEMGASVIKAPSEINTMWPRNLYDYYRTEYHPNGLCRTLWRFVFSAGLSSRAMILYLRAGKTKDIRYKAQAVRFIAFSRAVWGASR